MSDPTIPKFQVDGVLYPFDLAAVTAGQEQAVQRIGVGLEGIIERMLTGTLRLSEVVALMLVSLMQNDLPADPEWLLRHVTIASDVGIVTPAVAA